MLSYMLYKEPPLKLILLHQLQGFAAIPSDVPDGSSAGQEVPSSFL